MRVFSYFLLFTFYFLLMPSPVSAHAFGTLYTLPIPLWLYLWGAGAALIVSFILIAVFARESTQLSFPRINIKPNRAIVFCLKILSVSLLILTILAGFFGTQSPIQNFAPNFFWIIFFLGFTYLTAIIGNVWETVSPFKILSSLLPKSKPLLSYPKNLGYFPALIFYFFLLYLELFSGSLGSRPFFISQLLIFYIVLTFVGCIFFGKRIYFEYIEFFSVFFALLSKLSPFSATSLLKDKPKSFSLVVFILFMLSSTAFDGFRSTVIYFRYFFTVNQILLLILSLLVFLWLYGFAIFFMKAITRTKISILNLSLHFAYSLIPIALAYNVAHYFTLLLTQGQQIIPLLSDPINLGWNILGTEQYQINVGIINAGFVWNFEVAVIILGHIVAVVFAHLLALQIFKRKEALLSQIPMLALMILYTITGLWILSQPLTVGG